MPELPEVETIRRDLEKAIVGVRISAVIIKNQKTVRGDSGVFVSGLVGSIIKEVGRRGKLLIFTLSKKDKFLLIHLKMTGQLIYIPHPNPLLNKEREYKEGEIIAGGHSLNQSDEVDEMKYNRVVIEFRNGAKLFFNDLRKFGYLEIVDSVHLEKVLAGFGIEPLLPDFKLEELKRIVNGKKTNIKAVLLNQKLIAGIGNIYADEILYAAKVFPGRVSSSLDDKEIKRIFEFSKKVLARAINERGTTFNNYVDGQGRKGGFVKFLKVYGRKGEKCRRCGGIIKKMKMAGRGTHYCECQF